MSQGWGFTIALHSAASGGLADEFVHGTPNAARLDVAGYRYDPIPASVADLAWSEDKSGEAQITCARDWPPARRLAAGLRRGSFVDGDGGAVVPVPAVSARLFLSRVEARAARQVFQGVFTGMRFERGQAVLTFTADAEARLDRDFHLLACSPQCQHALYSTACGANRALHTSAAVVSNIVSAQGLTYYTLTGIPAHLGNRLAGGILQAFGRDYSIQTSAPGAGHARVVSLLTPVPGLLANQPGMLSWVNVAAGCDRSATTCRTAFNNLARFGGFPLRPAENPYKKD